MRVFLAARIAFALLFCAVNASALNASDSRDFVFNRDFLLNEKSVNFFQNTSSELFTKTGVSLYVFMGKSLESRAYSDFRADFYAKLCAPKLASNRR